MELKEKKLYWGNGNIQQHYFLNKDNKFHGLYKSSQNSSGFITTEICYKNGIRHGLEKELFLPIKKKNQEDQFIQLIFVGTKKNKRRHGIKVTFSYFLI